MALIEARQFTTGAEINAHFKAIRKRLWKATGIVDPVMMTVKQKAEVEALRIAELAHPIAPRKAGAIKGSPKSRLIEMCEKSGVDYFDIVGPSRREIYTEIRHRLIGAIYIELTANGREFSLNQMGKLFDRDHSTIINSLKRCGILPNARPLKGRKTKLPKSGITGIIAMPNGKHRAEIHHGGIKYAAGTYDTIEQAIKARDILVQSIQKKSPLSVWQVYRLMGIEK